MCSIFYHNGHYYFTRRPALDLMQTRHKLRYTVNDFIVISAHMNWKLKINATDHCQGLVQGLVKYSIKGYKNDTEMFRIWCISRNLVKNMTFWYVPHV